MAYTTINDSSAHFQTTLYTGNGGTQNITNGGNSNLRPDWVWIKDRSANNDHKLTDSVRGTTYTLESNENTAEYNDTDSTTAYLTDGFSLGANGNVNTNSNNYVAWQWAAGGTAPTKTYKVVVVSDSGNKYRFRNSADNATFAASAVTLDLQEGGTYTFDVSDNTVDSHPFVLGTSANSNEYSTGVTYKLDGVTKTYSQYTSGFSAATTRQLIITVAASAPTLYYWCSQHSGMGGQVNTNSTFGSTNFDGTILSRVNANPTAGFSIVTFTTNGSGSQTVGHGLGATPLLSIRKIRDTTSDWFVHNTLLDGTMDYVKLNTNGQNSGSSLTAFSSTTIGADSNSEDYVAYVFAPIKGFSAFGSYQGTGNAEGPFVYTGFKPAWLLVKSLDVTQNWQLWDLKRNSSTPVPPIGNPRVRTLSPSVNNSETGDYEVDFYSMGFKIRNNDAAWNGDSNNYIYLTFAENPLVASGTVSTGG